MPVVSGIGEASEIAAAIVAVNNVVPSEIDENKIKEEMFGKIQ